jgi:hypothetical protein
MIKLSSPARPDDVDTGWDDPDEAETSCEPSLVRASSPAEPRATAAELDSGWDDLEPIPVKSESPRSFAPPLEAVDAGWDDEEEPAESAPERALERAGRPLRNEPRPGSRSVRSTPQMGQKALASLTKKQRRELERKQRAKLGQQKAERKAQRKLEREQQQKLLVEQRKAGQRQPSTETQKRKKTQDSAPKSAASLDVAKTERQKAPLRASSSGLHEARATLASATKVEPSSRARAPQPRKNSQKHRGQSTAEKSYFGRISLLVLFVLLVATALFAFSR